MSILRPLHLLPRWCAVALVPCLHHHHPYREPRHRKRGRLDVMALAVHDERANDRLEGGARVARRVRSSRVA
ncbi:hypothetical protein B0H13DRAFT_2086969 [Mycena leptocephala]|nr:hypothetical protein B0H13DRAFT_2086969 [Mycena leptocephala]